MDVKASEAARSGPRSARNPRKVSAGTPRSVHGWRVQRRAEVVLALTGPQPTRDSLTLASPSSAIEHSVSGARKSGKQGYMMRPFSRRRSMAKDTPFDRARDFVEEKIDRTKEVLGDSYSKARDQFDDVSDDVRKSVKQSAKKLE